MEDKVFSPKVIEILKALWVNQAGACLIAKAVFEEYAIDNEAQCSFHKRCDNKIEQSPYDEFE